MAYRCSPGRETTVGLHGLSPEHKTAREPAACNKAADHFSFPMSRQWVKRLFRSNEDPAPS